MTFVPGQSGNPGGRKAKSPDQKEFEELCRKASPMALNVLRRIVHDPKVAAAARVAAATAIMDRGYGRPTQPIEQDLNVYNYGIADKQPTADEWLDKYTRVGSTPVDTTRRVDTTTH